jgi:hypothetical protein
MIVKVWPKSVVGSASIQVIVYHLTAVSIEIGTLVIGTHRVQFH